VQDNFFAYQAAKMWNDLSTGMLIFNSFKRSLN